MSLNEKFIINLNGKSYVTYEGLLDLAHKKNLKSINVELVQLPTKENNFTAVCKATAISGDGNFTDYGDASPASVNSRVVPHLIRMASTRAKARTLRDLTNVGITAFEEVNVDEFTFNTDDEIINKNIINKEQPTKRQLETIKKLSESRNVQINYDILTKRTAGQLISKMLGEKTKKH